MVTRINQAPICQVVQNFLLLSVKINYIKKANLQLVRCTKQMFFPINDQVIITLLRSQKSIELPLPTLNIPN